MNFFHNCFKIKCANKRFIWEVIWILMVWSIWLNRNAVIFKGEPFSFTDGMTEIVFNSWRWLCSFYKRKDLCNFYCWNILPLSYFEI